MKRFFEALSNAHEFFVFCNPWCDSDHGTPQKMGHSSITHSIALLHLFTHFLHNAPALLSLTPRSLHSIQSRESILEITMAPQKNWAPTKSGEIRLRRNGLAKIGKILKLLRISYPLMPIWKLQLYSFKMASKSKMLVISGYINLSQLL